MPQRAPRIYELPQYREIGRGLEAILYEPGDPPPDNPWSGEPASLAVDQVLAELPTLERLLGIPCGQAQVAFFPGIYYGHKWRDFWVECVGETVENIPVRGRPHLVLSADPSGMKAKVYIQIRLRRVRYSSSPAYLEAIWKDGQGSRVTLGGLEGVSKVQDATKVLKGIELIRTLGGLGRPPGSTEWPEPRFRRKLTEAVAKCRERGNDWPSEETLAFAMPMSVRTFVKCKVDYGVDVDAYRSQGG